MIYDLFEHIQKQTIKSNKDLCIFYEIVESFTYKKVEVAIDRDEISKKCNCSKRMVSSLIKRLIKHQMLYRVKRGIYRLNPYAYIPYKADGAELQQEWNRLVNK